MRDRVLAALAGAVLGDVRSTAEQRITLGPYRLHPHQQDAVLRLTPTLQRFGGALLADDVGLGKTFVALAIARSYQHVDVIAPAGLVRMWQDASTRCQLHPAPACLSMHRFSHSQHQMSSESGQRLVVIDEAHHLRNANTVRYAKIAQHCRSAHVLLLTATPVHNRASDLAHLYALFLGTRAHALSSAEQLALMVRRSASVLDDRAHQVQGESGHASRPSMQAHPAISLRTTRDIADESRTVALALADLPPPVPTRDGTAAGALIALGLLRSWCSSAGACLAAVRRRQARALALDRVLAEGKWPSQRELRTWTISEDTVQLGFTALLVDDSASRTAHAGSDSLAGSEESAAARIADARAQLALHRQALHSLESRVRRAGTSLDRARAECVRRVRARHPGVTVIAFTQLADTVHAIGRVLRWDSGVATLTSRGGRVAGGPLTRSELLRRVAPHAHGAAPPPPHERIALLITTDMLAEGVNLQDAAVVVHLDLPWTPAAIAQREGRVARLGSAHRTVHAYMLSPPGEGDTLLRLADRLRRKARAMSVVLAPDAPATPRRNSLAPLGIASPMQDTLLRWQRSCTSTASAPNIAAVAHARPGWLAAVGDQLVGGWFPVSALNDSPAARARPRTRALRDPRSVGALVRAVDQAASSPLPHDIVSLVDAVRQALQRELRAAQRFAVVETLQSPLVRAHRLIRRALVGTSLSERVRLAPLADAASRAVRSLRGAGDERALAALLDQCPTEASPEAWLRDMLSLATVQPHEETNTKQRDAGSDSVPWHTLVLLLPLSSPEN